MGTERLKRGCGVIEYCVIERKPRIHPKNVGLYLYVLKNVFWNVFAEFLNNPGFLRPHLAIVIDLRESLAV
jgi:hypothetical protein